MYSFSHVLGETGNESPFFSGHLFIGFFPPVLGLMRDCNFVVFIPAHPLHRAHAEQRVKKIIADFAQFCFYLVSTHNGWPPSEPASHCRTPSLQVAHSYAEDKQCGVSVCVHWMSGVSLKAHINAVLFRGLHYSEPSW